MFAPDFPTSRHRARILGFALTTALTGSLALYVRAERTAPPAKPEKVEATPRQKRERNSRTRREERETVRRAAPAPAAAYALMSAKPVFGPPTPPEMLFARQQAAHLLKSVSDGRLRLFVPARETAQLRALACNGVYCWPTPPAGVSLVSPRQPHVLQGTRWDELTAPVRPQLAFRHRAGRTDETETSLEDGTAADGYDPCARPPSPALLRTLHVLADRSTPAHPLTLLSLLRPPYRFGPYQHVGLANPHSLGLAADIASFGGWTVQPSQPEACVRAFTTLLAALPPGRYRLGTPKAPQADAPDFSPALAPEHRAALSAAAPGLDWVIASLQCAVPLPVAAHAPSAWPFFPAPERVCAGGMLLPIAMNACSPVSPRYPNEDYAPEADLSDARLRRALAAARERGVNIIALFPDAADHIHLDVRQTR